VPELENVEVREIMYRNFRIIYRLKHEILEIVRIIHGSRILNIIIIFKLKKKKTKKIRFFFPFFSSLFYKDYRIRLELRLVFLSFLFVEQRLLLAKSQNGLL